MNAGFSEVKPKTVAESIEASAVTTPAAACFSTSAWAVPATPAAATPATAAAAIALRRVISSAIEISFASHTIPVPVPPWTRRLIA